QLGPCRQLDLGHRNEVVETCLSRGFLLEEPAHLVAGRLLGEPREQRIALARPARLQLLEPFDEAVGSGRRSRRAVDHRLPQPLAKSAFEAQRGGITGYASPPGTGRKRRREPAAVPLRELLLEIVVEKLRASLADEGVGGHDRPDENCYW